jgi:hypothetical protein
MRTLGNFFVRKRATIAFLAFVCAMMLAVHVVDTRATAGERKTTRAAIVRERDAQLLACERIQVLRDQANLITFIAYDAWAQGAKREHSLIKGDPTNAEKHRLSEANLTKTAHRLVATGPTACIPAVDHPESYIPPSPELIYKNGARVQIARKRSNRIVYAAEHGLPLYPPFKRPR